MEKRAIAAVVFCLATIVMSGKPCQARSYKESNPKKEEPKPAVTFANNQGSGTHPQEADNNPPHWYAPLKRPEWWLVIAAFATIGVIGWQSVMTGQAAKATAESVRAIKEQVALMERQTKATEDAAKASARNVELIIKKERARIIVGVPDDLILTRNDVYPEIRYEIHVWAPTPAIIVDAQICAYTTDFHGSDQTPSYVEGLSSTDTRKSSTLERKVFLFEVIDEDLIDAIDNKRKFVHFYGFIKYRDIFQDEEMGVPHETRFGYLWDVGDKGILGGILGTPSKWIKDGANHET